jgi:hypothetical protein
MFGLVFLAVALLVAPVAVRLLDNANARHRMRQWERERNPPDAE